MAQQVIEKIPSVKGQRTKKFADSFACTYIISVFAASIAELCKYHSRLLFIAHRQRLDLFIVSFSVTYPLDLTKTRLQIQGEKGVTHVSKLMFLSHFYYLGVLNESYILTIDFYKNS
jgi:hypothetical protein